MVDIKKLLGLGLLLPVASGIQIDVNAVRRSDGTEGSLCDHNCTTAVGNYDCPAAFSVNKGMNKRFASVNQIISWVMAAYLGLTHARERFTSDGRDNGEYFDTFKIPEELRRPIIESVKQDDTEVNLFGGNPEMHPDITELIGELKSRGLKVNLTTTGRRFITDSDFVGRFVQNPANVLALSADDIELARLEELLTLDLDQLKSKWKKVNPLHGQEQKFLEGIFTARLLAPRTQPKIIFNMVIHPGNLTNAEKIIWDITQTFPNVMMNPYPAQSSFLYEDGAFEEEDFGDLEYFIDLMIDMSKNPRSRITKRLHYWLVLKSVMVKHFNDPVRAIRMLAGYDTWRCYRKPLLPYLQIGRGSSNDTLLTGLDDESPGGKLGCFWNDQTVSQEIPIKSSAQVEGYIISSMKARSFESRNPCQGCLMPRLMFNMITTELGLDPDLVPTYLALREEHAGF